MNIQKKLAIIVIGSIAAIGIAVTSFSSASAQGFNAGPRWMHQESGQDWQRGPQYQGQRGWGRGQQWGAPGMRQDAPPQGRQGRNFSGQMGNRGPQGPHGQFGPQGKGRPAQNCCCCPHAQAGAGYGSYGSQQRGYGFPPHAQYQGRGFRGQGYGPGPWHEKRREAKEPRLEYRGQGYGPGPWHEESFRGEPFRGERPDYEPERAIIFLNERLLNALQERNPDLAAEARERLGAGETPHVVLDNILDKLAGQGSAEDKEFAESVRERMEDMRERRQERMNSQGRLERQERRQEREGQDAPAMRGPRMGQQMTQMMTQMGRRFLSAIEAHSPELAEQARERIRSGEPPHEVFVDSLNKLSNSEDPEASEFAKQMQERMETMHQQMIERSEQRQDRRTDSEEVRPRAERRQQMNRMRLMQNPERINMVIEEIEDQIEIMENRLESLQQLKKQASEDQSQTEEKSSEAVKEKNNEQKQETNGQTIEAEEKQATEEQDKENQK